MFLRISASFKGVPRIAGGFMCILGGALQRFSEVPGGFKGVSGGLREFKGVLGRSDSVSLKGFQKVSRGVSGYFRKFQDEVLRKFQGVPETFQGCFRDPRGSQRCQGI